MTRSPRPSALRIRRTLAALLLAAPLVGSSLLLAAAPVQARGGGGGGFGGGGFGGGGRGFGGASWGTGAAHWGGGGGYHFNGAGGDAWRNGYGGFHPMYGPGTRQGINVDTFNRNVNVNTNFYNRDFNGWNRDWNNGGYWGSRPWGAGWYSWAPASWGWWGASAAAWGVAGLATGAAITSLVNAASVQQSPVIVVPQTSYQLNFGSVESVGSAGVSFSYYVNGTQLLGAANCQDGLLNGQVPGDPDQAQLLNAVCQVAYGAGS
ncbi:hypothetical protein [Vulcanococcus limneticus]|uniref:hypothetical protein n=1 Tax=Vulcanococcus limneticus TaxID=2170428 RepID=UPI00398BD175